MHYIVQQNLFNEKGFHELIRVLEGHGLSYDVVQIIPFTHDLIPNINPPQPCMVYGSVRLTQIAKARGWTPGAFMNENFDTNVWTAAYGEHTLNADARTFRFADVPLDMELFFIRPCNDEKAFTGELLEREEFAEWREKVLNSGSTVDGDTLVAISSPKHIYQEYRFFVIKGRVITGSSYKVGGRANYNYPVPPEVKRFAQDRVDQWVPDDGFVIDIAVTDDGLKVIEINCMNGAGFYECDLSAIIQAIEEY